MGKCVGLKSGAVEKKLLRMAALGVCTAMMAGSLVGRRYLIEYLS